MTARDLRLWLDSIQDQDREIPIEIVIGTMDMETRARLMAFLSYLFLFSDNPVVQNEALALSIRLQIP